MTSPPRDLLRRVGKLEAQAGAGAKVPLTVVVHYVDAMDGSRQEAWRKTFMVEAAVAARLRMRTWCVASRPSGRAECILAGDRNRGALSMG